jgi:hypothetical protein
MREKFQEWADNNDGNEKNGTKGNDNQQIVYFFLHAEEKNKQRKSAKRPKQMSRNKQNKKKN